MKRSATLLLLLLILATPLISVVGAAHSAALDIRDPTAEDFSCALPPSILLRAILGEQTGISTAELAYLDSQDSLYLLYSDAVTHHSVTVSQETDDTWLITAMPYTYTSKNGVTVTWIPTHTVLAGHTYPLTKEGEAYTALLPAEGNTLHTASVSYTVTLTLSEALATDIANRAYTDGLAAYTAGLLYKEELKEHQERADAYLGYLAALEIYTAKKEAYDHYTAAQALYEKRLLAYEHYQTACKEFVEMQERYESYLAEKAAYEEARIAYVSALADALLNEEAYHAYLAYTEEVRVCRERLAIMDHILHEDYRFYSSLVGGAVTTVLERRGELVALGCSAEVLENTAAVTERLRTVLPLYLACEEESARYAFYTAHYADIRDDIHTLSTSLYTLFANPHVQLAIDSQGKLDRYMQFVGQLYVADMLLSDTTTFSDDWSISSTLAYKPITKSLSEAIGTLMPIPEDTNCADPRGTAYPEKAGMELPSDLPTAPTPPLVIRRPTEPEFVAEPTAPTAVPSPGDPPATVLDPGEAPTPPVTDENLLVLADAVGSLSLTAREGITATAINLARTVDIAIGSEEEGHTVLLYDEDQRSLLAALSVDDGAPVTYTPPRKQDAVYNFDFSCFVDESGNPTSLTEVTSSLVCYARYTRSARTYTVTWQIGELNMTTEHPYGEIPAPPDQPKYEILSYDKALRPVTADTTYTASYRLRRYDISFLTPSGEMTIDYQYGETPTVPAPYDRYFFCDGTLRPFVSVTPAITAVSGTASYTLTYGNCYPAARAEDSTWSIEVGDRTEELAFLLSFAAEESSDLRLFNGAATLYLPNGTHRPLLASGAVSLTMTEEDGRLLLLIEDAQQAPLSAYPTGVTLYLPYDGDEDTAEYADISLTLGEKTVRLFTSYRQNELSCRLPHGGAVSVSEHFPINLPAERGGAVSAQTVVSNGEERVLLSVYPARGYRLRSLRVTDSKGTEIPLAEDNSFSMPRSPVTVTAEFEECLYTVRFFVDGVLTASHVYRYGETLIPPASPTKESENGIRYTFRFWSPTLLYTVVADAEYHAVFGEIYPGLTEILSGSSAIPPLYYAAGGVLLLLTSATVTACLLYRRKRKKANAGSE